MKPLPFQGLAIAAFFPATGVPVAGPACRRHGSFDWDRKGNSKWYYYRSVRKGSVAIKEYVGKGERATAAAQEIEDRQARRDARPATACSPPPTGRAGSGQRRFASAVRTLATVRALLPKGRS